ncbi:hypothetical protein JZ751_013269 [Albula glossodonta]|uniref:Uncharacterized protein n=1 Tax=Albula glossodonta TaxID=121402 RepID=A0A8T2NSH7_9TELE|nr:hypothetical protein JZ751_013269 [Albula glossodonta]
MWHPGGYRGGRVEGARDSSHGIPLAQAPQIPSNIPAAAKEQPNNPPESPADRRHLSQPRGFMICQHAAVRQKTCVWRRARSAEKTQSRMAQRDPDSSTPRISQKPPPRLKSARASCNTS